jgi:hypothetical protein
MKIFLLSILASILVQPSKPAPTPVPEWELKVLEERVPHKPFAEFDKEYSLQECYVLTRRDRDGVRLSASRRVGRVDYSTTVTIRRSERPVVHSTAMVDGIFLSHRGWAEGTIRTSFSAIAWSIRNVYRSKFVNSFLATAVSSKPSGFPGAFSFCLDFPHVL